MKKMTFNETNGDKLHEILLNVFISYVRSSLATELEKQSKISVEFLMNLKPIIQESLHKAIHWKTWDQLCTVQGPLSLKQLWQMNNNGVLTTCDPARIPRVVVGQDGNWLSVSPLALHHWVC